MNQYPEGTLVHVLDTSLYGRIDGKTADGRYKVNVGGGIVFYRTADKIAPMRRD